MADLFQELDAISGTKAPVAPTAPQSDAPTQTQGSGGLFAQIDAVSGSKPPVEAAAPVQPPKVTPPPKPKTFIQNVESGVGDAVKGVENFFGGNKPAPAPAPKPENLFSEIDQLTGTKPDAAQAPTATATKTAAPAAGLLSKLDSVSGTKPPAAVSPEDNGSAEFAPIGSEDNFDTADSTASENQGGDTLSFIKEAAQGFTKDFADIGVTGGEAIVNNLAPSYAARAENMTAHPTGLMSYLIGDKDATNLADSAAQYESSIKGSSFAKKYGLDKIATPLGVFGAVVPVSLDFVGIGGEKAAVSALAETTDIARTADILRTIGVHGDLVMHFAPDIAAMQDKTEIKAALDSIDALQKSTHATNPAEFSRAAESAIGGGADETKPIGEALKAPESDVKPGKVKVSDTAAKSSETAARAATQEAKAAPRSLSDITRELEDMKQQESFLKDALIGHPGRDLMKYRSGATGALPEVSRTATSKFGKNGDAIVQEALGQEASDGGDLDVGQAKVDEYISLRKQAQETSQYVKQLRQEMTIAKQAEKEKIRSGKVRAATQAALDKSRAKVEASRARARINPDEEGSQSMGDYLRRGAQRADIVGKEKPTAGMVQGKASEQAQKYAVDESKYGEIESGPFKGWATRLKNWYQDWIFHRQAVDVDVKLAMKPFESLKNEGFDWVYNFLGKKVEKGTVIDLGAAQRGGLYGQVSDQLGRWLLEEQNAGIKVADKDNYLPIYLKNAPEESEDALDGRRLGLRPGFSLQSTFKDYTEAIEAGYVPEFDNPYEILQKRAAAHYKAMADADMFRKGASEGWLVPKTALTDETRGQFRDVDSERFPSQQAAYGNTIYNGVWTAPTAVAEKINNYLEDPKGFGKFLEKAGNVGGILKNTALSVGIPGTGLSVHFWNVLPREIMLDFAISPLRAPIETARYAWYAINPRAATRFINENLKEALPLIHAGMKVTTEDHSISEVFAKSFKKVADDETQTLGGKVLAKAKGTSDMLHHLFGGNTFGKLLPARKIGNGIKLMKIYAAHGMTADEAARAAAEDINVVYGGINWESLGRDRNLQSFWRAAAMAPDYAETNLKMGARGVKSLFKGGIRMKIYRNMMTFLAGSYATANLINYENSGHFMWSNDILHQFSIDLGKDSNGKEEYFNIYGTGVDFVRIPLYAATAIATGRFDQLNSIIRNRLSIPLASFWSLVENVDWKGDPIFGPNKYGAPQTGAQQAENAFSNTIGNALPGSGQDLSAILSGQKSNKIGIAEAIGFPITEKSQLPTVADINTLRAEAAADIKNNDYRLFNKLVKAGVITARTKSAFIRSALYGKTAKQQRSAAKAKTKTATEKLNVQNLNLAP